jgi:hypothetical protein
MLDLQDGGVTVIELRREGAVIASHPTAGPMAAA